MPACDEVKGSDIIWEPAKYPGIYETEVVANLMISRCGHVRFLLRSHGHVTAGTKNGAGYLHVRRNGRAFAVHRLVAATFLGQPASADLDVNHKDGDRCNNRLENLEYVTRSENVRHYYALMEGQERSPRRGTLVQGCPLGSAEEAPWQLFASLAAAARETGIERRRILKLCQGQSEKVKSASWEFRLVVEEPLPGEEWRLVTPAILEGARAKRH